MLGTSAAGGARPRRVEPSSPRACASGAPGRASRSATSRAAGRSALALGLLLGALVACGREPAPAPELQLELSIAPSPPVAGPARLSLSLRDAAGAAVAGAAVHVEANMSHAGMVPELAEARELGAGRYEAALEWTMGGDWVLTFEITTRDGARHVLVEEVRGVRSDP